MKLDANSGTWALGKKVPGWEKKCWCPALLRFAIYLVGPAFPRACHAGGESARMPLETLGFPWITEAVMDIGAVQEFLQTNHRGVLATRRRDGSPQMTLVSPAVDDQG